MRGLLAGCLVAGTLGLGAGVAQAGPISTSFVSGTGGGDQVAHSRVRGWSTGWEAATGEEVGVPGHPNSSWNWTPANRTQSFVWDFSGGVSTLTINGRSMIESALFNGVTDLYLQLRATDYRGTAGYLDATDLELTTDGETTVLPDLSAASGWSGLLKISGLDGLGTSFRLEGVLSGNFDEIKEERIKIEMKAYYDPSVDSSVPSPGTAVLGGAGVGFLLLRRGV
ncbi:hypothetical protein [Mucisphaera sp.]|uniref:hypothetical protein n=1 Tax=Mucisphaera sp. TaxID=2913024 RepID=UPI003D0A11B4